jgi:ribosomal protein L39E
VRGVLANIISCSNSYIKVSLEVCKLNRSTLDSCIHDFQAIEQPKELTNRLVMSKLRMGNINLIRYLEDEEMVNPIIDGISLVGTIDRRVEERAILKLKKMILNRECPSWLIIKLYRHDYRRNAKSRYKRRYKITCGKSSIRLFLSSLTTINGNVKIAFNPSKVDLESLKKILSFIAKLFGINAYNDLMENIRVTRIDVALDFYDVPIHSVLMRTKKRKFSSIYPKCKGSKKNSTSKIVETRYSGVRGKGVITSYNKTVEIMKKAGECLDCFLTRVEIRTVPYREGSSYIRSDHRLDAFKFKKKYFSQVDFYSFNILKTLSKDARRIILNEGLDIYLSRLKRSKKEKQKIIKRFSSLRVLWDEEAAVSTLNKKLRQIKKLFISI